jgi:hypothetical protein
MLDELRADAKAGFPNKAAPWRRRDPSGVEAAESAGAEGVLSPECKAQLVEGLEAELLSAAHNTGVQTAGPIMDDLLPAIDDAIGDDLDEAIRHALDTELSRSVTARKQSGL